MNSATGSQSRSWWTSLLAVLLAVAFSYLWIVPLFRPRGDFLWGHYRLKDIYLGIPIALLTLSAVVILAVPARHRRWTALRVVTVAVSLLVGLAVCDVVYAFGVRGALHSNFWLDQAHIARKYSIADAELGFARKPFVTWRGYLPDANRIVDYRADENGFRNPPGQRQADVVFIGDSYTEAAQVEEPDTFVNRVAQSTGLTTVNLGRGAYGPQQELIVLKRYGLSYKPRAVVWQLFEGNDLSDAQQFAEWKQNPHQTHTSLKERYFDNSLLNEWLTNTRAHRRRGPTVTLRYHDGTARRIELRHHHEPRQPANTSGPMTDTLNAIAEGHSLCEANGIQLLIVNVPTMVRLMSPQITFQHLEDQARFFPDWERTQNDFSATIREFCARNGCNFVDSFDALRQAADNSNDNLYIPVDEHFEPAAHEVLAQVISDWLRSKGVAGRQTQ